jgi:hypothetical protein
MIWLIDRCRPASDVGSSAADIARIFAERSDEKRIQFVYAPWSQAVDFSSSS